MHAISSTITAVLNSLTRPSNLITSMSSTQKAIDRHNLSVRRSDRWPLGLLDEARSRVQRDAQEKMDKSQAELADLGRELRYTQQVVASELASWQERRVEMGRKALRELARKMVVTEKARLESMKRAIRGLGIGERREGVEVNGVAGEGEGAGLDVGTPKLPPSDVHGGANGDAINGGIQGLGQELDDVMLPSEDGPQVEDLVEGPSDEPDEETPLLDLAAEAPEQLDGTVTPTPEDDAPPDLPPRR
jgi:hypothetical protein